MRYLPHQAIVRTQLLRVLKVDGILLAGTMLLLSGDLRQAVLWVLLPLMVVVLLSVRFGGWDYDHAHARLALAANLRGVLRAYGKAAGGADEPESRRLLASVAAIDDGSARAAEHWVEANVVVQPQLGRRAEIVLDWLLVGLGAAAGSAFTAATQQWSRVLPHEPVDLLVPALLVIAWFAVWRWIEKRKGFPDYRGRVMQLARDRPDELIHILPFWNEEFAVKFRDDALLATQIASAEPSELAAAATVAYQGSPPEADWRSSVVHKFAWKSSQLIGGVLLGVLLGVAGC